MSADPLPLFFRDGMAIMCTDRGNHRRKDLYQAYVRDGNVEIGKRWYGAGASKTGPGPRMYRPVKLGMVGARSTRTGEKIGRAQNFECTVCHRKLPVNFESIDLLLKAGYKALDLSYGEDTIRIVKHLASE
jgi:hypothetical protein